MIIRILSPSNRQSGRVDLHRNPKVILLKLIGGLGQVHMDQTRAVCELKSWGRVMGANDYSFLPRGKEPAKDVGKIGLETSGKTWANEW